MEKQRLCDHKLEEYTLIDQNGATGKWTPKFNKPKTGENMNKSYDCDLLDIIRELTWKDYAKVMNPSRVQKPKEQVFGKSGDVTKVIFSGLTTIVFFGKTKIIVRCSGNDTYDKEKAILMAYFQHSSGLSKTQTAKLMTKLMKED